MKFVVRIDSYSLPSAWIYRLVVYNHTITFYRVPIYQSIDSHISSPPLFSLFEQATQFPQNIYKTSEDKEQF